MVSMRDQVSAYIESLQKEIVAALESLDHNAPSFTMDSWVREQGGKGSSCSFAAPVNLSSNVQSTVLEKAGVNISMVHGILPPHAISQMRVDHSSIPHDQKDALPFFAAGLSLIIHPQRKTARHPSGHEGCLAVFRCGA
jgi:coproporphyrinogen III oxidase